MNRKSYFPKPTELADGEPFSGPDEAWFWAYIAQYNLLDGAKIVAGKAKVKRPCDPRDIWMQLSRLYRQGRIQQRHLKVLKESAKQQAPPDQRLATQRPHYELWRQAMLELGSNLYQRGLVTSPEPIFA